MSKVKVISLGGSLIVPDQVDVSFLRDFSDLITEYLDGDEDRRIIIVCGGGSPAREYQKAYRELADASNADAQDWIGISATRLNAELLRQLFLEWCPAPVVDNPSAVSVFPGRILVACGWKPGFSKNYDAVLLAEKFFADSVLVLTNISKVYTDDPKVDPNAEPLDTVSWEDFRDLVGETWIPGKNVPFDPIAAKYASQIKLKVVVVSGKNMANLASLLNEEGFEGTTIGPE
jgi:uridylate kinase